MDPNAIRNESVPEGLLAAVAQANHETYAKNGTPEKATTDPAATGATGAQNKHTPKQTKTQTPADEATDDDEELGGDNAEGLDTQDYSRTPATEPEVTPADETNDAATGEPLQTNTDTNNEANDDWKKSLPAPPPAFTLVPPTPDEDGNIDPLVYTNYVKEAAKAEIRQETYNNLVVSRAFEEAEKVLPELKSNPTVQTLVRQAYLSEIYSGEPGDVVAIARNFKTLLGGAKSEGANNAKSSITIQKNAAVETTGATQKKATPSKNTNLDKRLQKNDTSAFEELMNGWMRDGKV